MRPAGREGGVGRVVGSVRRGIAGRFALAAFLSTCTAAAAVLLLAWGVAGPGGWEQGATAPLLLDLLLLCGLLAIAAFLWRRRGLLREDRVAANMEEAARLESGVLFGSMELGRSLPGGVSPSLARLAEEDLLKALEGAQAPLSGELGSRSSRWIRRTSRLLGLLIPVVVLLALLSPNRSRAAWSGLSSPLRLLSDPLLPELVVSPGSVEIPRGGSVEIEVFAPGRDEISLYRQLAGDVVRGEKGGVADGVARFTISEISVPVEYWAAAEDGAESARFRITPVDPLFLSDLRVELTFPPHTGRVPEEYRRDVPPLTIPEGTRIRVEGHTSRPLATALLKSAGRGGRTAAFQISGRRFEGEWTPRVGGRWEWILLDEDGDAPERGPAPLHLTLAADSIPSVAMLFPGRDTILSLTLRQPLVIEAGDDYGIARIELEAYRVSIFGERGEPVVRRLPIRGARAAMVRPLLNVSTWGLLPGDTVRYRARVVDNSPRPQVAETPEFALRMPGRGELSRDAQERLEEMAGRMKELAGRAAELAKEDRDLARRALAREDSGATALQKLLARGEKSQPIGFRDREDLRRALGRQDDLVGDLDSLESELGRLARSMMEAGLPDPDLRRDLRELGRLLEEVTDPSLRERLDELSRDLEDMSPERLNRALEELVRSQEEMRDRVARSLEEFRRAAVEQDFRASAAEAKELAERQRALAEVMKGGEESGLRAERQRELEERAETLEERLARLEERLRQLGEEEAGEGMAEVRQRAGEAREAMSRAARAARRSDAREAGEEGSRAAEGMEEVSEELQRLQDEMMREMEEALEAALRELASEALALARRQGEIRARARGAVGERIGEVRADEGALLQGVRNLAGNFSARGRFPAGGARMVSEAIGEAEHAIRRAVDAMEDRGGRIPPGASTASERAMDALNGVALAALSGAARMAGGGEGRLDQMLDRLERLAQQQGDLTSQTNALVPMMGQQAMAGQLQEIAEGQAAVAGGLGELAKEPGSADQALGDLGELEREARELAEKLAAGRLDPETIDRQQRLFRRLLDAGRSLEKEEFSENRESRAGESAELGEVGPLTVEELGGVRYRLPSARILGRLSPARRALVIAYFERLNREMARRVPRGRTGGGGEK